MGNDRRRSNPAGFRSRLTFRSLLQQSPPIRGLLVCDDTAVRQNSRLSSSPFLGALYETSPTPGRNGPRNLKADTSPLASHGSGVGSEQQREFTPMPPLVG